MFRTVRLSLALLGMVGFIAAAGCGPTPANNVAPVPVGNGDPHAGHDHAHHGPHGGHIVEIGEEEYHAEWTHDDSGLITVYILDSEMKKEVPIAAEKIVITVTTTKTDEVLETPYELLAANASEGEMPKASRFELTDKALLGSMETLTPGAVEAALSLEIDGKSFPKVAITHDEHQH